MAEILEASAGVLQLAGGVVEGVQGRPALLVRKHVNPFSPVHWKHPRTYLPRSSNPPGLVNELVGTVSTRRTPATVA